MASLPGNMVVQGLVTLRGRGAIGDNAVTFYPHRRDFLWVGDARGLVVTVEVLDLTSENANKTTIQLQTGPALNGPWSPILSPAISTTGTYTYYLERNPAGTGAQQVGAYLRWAVVEHLSGAGAWSACFRVTVLKTVR